MCNSLTLTPNQMLSDFYSIFLEKGKKLGKPERDHMNKLIEVRQVQLVAAAIRACDPVMNVVLKELSLELSMAVKQLTTPDLSGKQCLQTDSSQRIHSKPEQSQSSFQCSETGHV